MGLVADLSAVVGAQWVLSNPLERYIYGKDAGVTRGNAAVIVLPATTAETAACVRIGHEHGVVIVARGTGTGLAGGAVPPEGSMVLATTRMDQIREVDIASRTAWVGPGVINLDLSRHTARCGLHFAPDPSSQPACTIGGNVATNAGGPHCLADGTTIAHVLGIEFVTADGDVVALGGAAPDPSGLDLRAVMVGSEGTLGIITGVLVKLTEVAPAVRTMLFGFDRIEDAAAAVSAIIAAGIVPAALEMMDAPMVAAVENFVHAGYPDDAAAVLLAEVAGHPAGVAAEGDLIERFGREHGAGTVRIAADDSERDLLWKGRKSAFGAVAQAAPDYYLHDTVVPRTRLVAALSGVYEIAQRHGLAMLNVFHAGDGNLHPLVAFDAADAAVAERVRTAAEEMAHLSIGLGGVLSGEHGIGLEKRDLMPLVFTEAELDAQARLRDAFDPERVLNPDKVLPAGSRRSEFDFPGSDAVNPATALAPFAAEVPGAPAAEFTVAPASAAEAATVLATASRYRLRVLVWGAGTHQGYGYRVDPDVVLATSALDDLLEWEPDDLTLTVGTGVTVSTIEDHVGERRQSALLPESESDATAGGIVAAGLSGWRRLRFGPTRDRVLEAVIVTGDGRVIKGGARLVKNATGYDLPRLATGSFGSLGLIAHVCFKLWPEPPRHATVTVSDPESAFQTAFRPLAVVEERDRSRVYLAGTDAEIAAQATDLGGAIRPGHHWPDPLDGLVRLVLRVPAGRTADAVTRLAPDWSYQAAHGVGEIRIGAATTTPEAVTELRDWAESIGGALVIAAAPESLSGVVDPWGTPPASLPLQRRVKEAFDPAGVMNPGRLPGGL